MTDAIATVAGEQLTLMPERCAYWERTRTLLVADPHFGKAAAFRAAGVPVPRGTTTETLRRLDEALDRTGAARLIFLGDFLHAKEGRSPETLRVMNEWRASRASIDMTLVRGNHDARAGDPPRELELRCVNGPLADGPFAFAHHPVPAESGYVLAGHVHPGFWVRDVGRLPCFAFTQRVAILPAFGEFTGLADVNVAEGDRVWVVAGDSVMRVSPD